MMDRVLVPLDGSLLAERILPPLRRMLYLHDSEIILVRAAVPAPVDTSFLITDASLKIAREYLEGIQERLRQEGARVKAVSRIGSAVSVILDVAEEEKATMMALATHGETGLKRLLVGSVSESLMRKSSIPLFVVRPFWSYDLVPGSLEKADTRPIRSILLPVERSYLTPDLLAPLIEFVQLFDSRVLILHVKDPRHRERKDTLEAAPDGRVILEECSRILEDRGVKTLSLLEVGDPADEILKAVRAQDADLVAMATHGRSGIDRLLKGSVTERVLRESICPLLVVRSPAQNPRQGACVEDTQSQK